MNLIGPLNAAIAPSRSASRAAGVAGIVPPGVRPWLWAPAWAMVVATPIVTGVGEFTVGAGHFVERHGVAVIIVRGQRRAGSTVVEQSGVVCEDGGLYAVGAAGAGEDAADVRLDRAGAQIELIGDLRVGQACPEQP